MKPDTSDAANNVDLYGLFRILWLDKWLVILFIFICFISSIIYSLSLNNIYKSEAILAQAYSTNHVSQNQNYSGLANLAGIRLSSGSGNKSDEAIEKMKSLSFFKESVLPNIYIPNLLAEPLWDPATNKITYNSEIYDQKSKKWIRKVGPLKSIIPTSQEAFTAFSKSYEVNQNDGFIFVSIKHNSPYISQKWTQLVISEINATFRLDDRQRAERSIDYLNKQMTKTSLTEIKQALSELIQNEIQKLTLIQASEEYVFKYIDPPVVEEIKHGPSRSIIVLLTTIFGAFVGVFIVLIKFFIRNRV